MSIKQTTTTDPRKRRTGGLYDRPVVGNAEGAFWDFDDGKALTRSDNVAVSVAKEIFRDGSVVVVAAGAVVVML